MYLIIFFILSILCFVDWTKSPNKIILILLTIFFIIIVGFRGDDVDNDYMQYYNSIKYPKSSGIAEVSFKYISNFLYSIFNTTTIVFLFYAVLGMSLKVYNIKKYTNYFWLSFLIYFCTFFILQEMNAIRAGVACGFMLLSINYWGKKDYIATLLLLLISGFFHYSFLILIPLIFLVQNNKKYLVYYILLIPIAYILYYSIDFSIIATFFSFTYAKEKLSGYDDEINMTNVLSTVFFIKIFLIFILYFYRKILEKKNENFYLFLKLYCIGIFIVIALAKYPAASMRFMDLFIIVELFLIPLICYLFPKKLRFIPITLIVIYSYFYFYLYIDLAKYIKDYYFIFEAKWI